MNTTFGQFVRCAMFIKAIKSLFAILCLVKMSQSSILIQTIGMSILNGYPWVSVLMGKLKLEEQQSLH